MLQITTDNDPFLMRNMRSCYVVGQIRKHVAYFIFASCGWNYTNNTQYDNVSIKRNLSIYARRRQYYIGDRHVYFKGIGAAIDAFVFLDKTRERHEYRELNMYIKQSQAAHSSCKAMYEKILHEIITQITTGFDLNLKARLSHIYHIEQRAQNLLNRVNNWTNKQIKRRYCHDDQQARDDFWIRMRKRRCQE